MSSKSSPQTHTRQFRDGDRAQQHDEDIDAGSGGVHRRQVVPERSRERQSKRSRYAQFGCDLLEILREETDEFAEHRLAGRPTKAVYSRKNARR